MLISPNHQKFVVPLLVLSLVALMGGVAVMANSMGWLGSSNSDSTTAPTQPAVSPIVQEVIMASPIVVSTPAPKAEDSMDNPRTARKTGTIICLPKKNATGPQTMECAFGLQTDEGNYGLNDTDPGYANISGVEMGVEVMVIGQVKPKPAADSYDSIGVIDVVRIDSR